MFIRTLIAACALAVVPMATPAASAEDASIQDFATRPVMFAPGISPDGEKVAYRAAQTAKGDYYIEVRDANNLKRKPVRIGSDKMSITGFNWISDNHLLVSFTQQVRNQVKAQEDSVFESKRAIFRADGKGRFVEIYDDTQIVSSLPDEPNYVLVRTSKFNSGDERRIQARGQSIGELQNQDFYKLNVRTGAVTFQFKSESRLGDYQIDRQGRVRVASEYDEATRDFIYYSRSGEVGSEWREFHRVNVDEYTDRFTILGFDPMDPNYLLVSATRGNDKAAVYTMNMNTGEYGEQILALADQDVEQTITSPSYANPNEIMGFAYYNEQGRPEGVFLDGEMNQLYETLRSTFPGQDVFLTRQSRDKTALTFWTRNWDNPGTYYMLKDGELQILGYRQPTLTAEKLHRQEFFEYEGRDGTALTAYVTMPKGEGPHPAIVMPHGGPWVSYRPGAFDEWSQFLASRGYMVIDPLFRGSTGLGTDHWVQSFGEWGKVMSDDMDDSALHMVKQGLVDPDRIAMFGWSFGGYASMAASVRDPQIYQCSIPGAGVSDPIRIRAAFIQNRAQRPLLTIGYDGVIPMEEIDKVNIPMLILHGEFDRRVRIRQSQDFVSALKRADKPHKFVVLEGADHFGTTLGFDNRMEMYTEMENFLANDCGPGGL